MRIAMNKWTVIVFVCFIVLLLGGGGVFYFYFSAQKNKSNQDLSVQKNVSKTVPAPLPTPANIFSGKVLSVKGNAVMVQEVSLQGKITGKVYNVLVTPQTRIMKKKKNEQSGMETIVPVSASQVVALLRNGQEVDIFTNQALSVDSQLSARQIIYTDTGK